ncbi:MAG: hypothetical protein JEZ14_25795 [Marinilabiliaceae bacterium]|nr:hypothetical protein [Marinilabiliaceae bacterium]
MSYYEDFDEEQRRNFESDPMLTGTGDETPGCLVVLIVFVIGCVIAKLMLI